VVHFGEVRRRSIPCRRRRREQQPLQLRVVQLRWQGPRQPGCCGPLQKALYRSFAYQADRRNLAFAQVDFMMESENFSDLTHR
jgi:hypothetical protein